MNEERNSTDRSSPGLQLQAGNLHDGPLGATMALFTIECAACGSTGYSDDRYCACCGRGLLQRCSGCDAAIRHRIANYCTQCGAALVENRKPVRSQSHTDIHLEQP